MEDNDIIKLWKAQDAKLEQSLALNLRLLKEMQSQKAQSAMLSLIRLKTFGIVAGVLWLVVLGLMLAIAIINYTPNAIYFVVSMGAIFLTNIKGVSDYIRHLIWANAIDYEGSITEIQEKLIRIKMSVIKHSRFMVLQFPFWTTFYLSPAWFPNAVGVGYWIFQFAITAAFCWFAWFLYRKLDIKNVDKPWYGKLIAGSGGKAVSKAIAFYKELEEFKTEAPVS